MGFSETIQIVIITLFILVLAMSSGLSAPASFDFDHIVEGQTITLRPTIDSAYDEYRWTIDGFNGLRLETKWIDVDDIYNHMTTLTNATTYLVKLHVRCSTGTWFVGKHIRIGSNHTLTIADADTTELGYSNIIDTLPDSLKNLHPAAKIIIGVVVIASAISFIWWNDRIVVFKRIK